MQSRYRNICFAGVGAALLTSAPHVRAETTDFESRAPLAPLDHTGPAPTIDSPDSESEFDVPPEPAQSAEETLLQPFTISPRTHAGRALARSVAGYDQSVDAFVSRSLAEARLLDFLTLHMEFDYGPGMGPESRFSIGGRAQVLNAADHGLDGGVGLFYQPNDFRDEGHVVAALLVGRFFGPFGLFANGMIGGDPEADDAAAEGRLSAMLRLSPAFRVGWDSRFRYNMSTDEKRHGTMARNWEAQSLANLSFTLGPIALLGEFGVSSVSITGPFGAENEETSTDTGIVALAGAGGAF